MVSATFGKDLWSTKGAGIGRVVNAIKVRVGQTVTLVVQNEKEAKARAKEAVLSATAKRDKFIAEQQKRDQLLQELDQERKGAVGGGFGLFKKNFGLWGSETGGDKF